MSTIQDRIFELIKHTSNNNKSRFSTTIGVSPTVIENIVGTRGSKPSYDVLEKIIHSFVNLNIEWLMTGQGKVFLDGKKSVSESVSEDQKNDYPITSNEEKNATVPFYNLPVSALEKINLNVGSAGHVDLPVFRGAECVLPVIGLNMEPVIYSGDLIGVKNVKPSNWDYLRTGEIYLVITHSEQLIAYVNDASNNKYIVCSRSNFAPFKINKSDILQLWRIVAIARGV